MGGHGSGRWGQHKKKQTVEGCTCLSVIPGARITGTMPTNFLTMDTEAVADTTYLVLRWDLKGEDRIRLVFWTPPMGGKSVWMVCPWCDRKCRKLFAPPGAEVFRCWRCWDLSYSSSQESHDLDRGAAGAVMAQVARNCGCSMREVARVLKAERRSRR